VPAAVLADGSEVPADTVVVGVGMEYIGYHHPGSYDEVVYRGDLDEREFCALWLAGGVLQASMNVNVWDVVSAATAVIGRPVDAAKLADPDVPLADVAS